VVATVRAMTEPDWPQVQAIYAAGIAGGDATFELEPPDCDEFDDRHLPAHRFVVCDADGQVLGWAAVSPTSSRAVYSGVVEVSVYVDPAATGQGVGRALLGALIESTETAGIWTLNAGIFPENLASLALHERLGFRRVGVRERIGRHHGHWRDVVLLERRSSAVD
jgi:L-amino acid N-acyltransferase YncA